MSMMPLFSPSWTPMFLFFSPSYQSASSSSSMVDLFCQAPRMGCFPGVAQSFPSLHVQTSPFAPWQTTMYQPRSAYSAAHLNFSLMV